MSAAAHSIPGIPFSAHRIQFIDEDDSRCFRPGSFEQFSQSFGWTNQLLQQLNV